MKETNNVIGILNTSILTCSGTYSLADITLDQAIDKISTSVIDSAVGHQGTAEILTKLLGIEIPMNRQLFQQQVGQECVIFKLLGRPAEGAILTREEIEAIGYKVSAQ